MIWEVVENLPQYDTIALIMGPRSLRKSQFWHDIMMKTQICDKNFEFNENLTNTQIIIYLFYKYCK